MTIRAIARPITVPPNSTIKHVQSHNTVDNDECITITNTTVIWSIGTHTLLQHTLNPNTTLIDVLLCHFTCTTIDTLNDQWLVIVCSNSITTYGSDGTVYNIVVPFKVKRCTLLLEGLLFERLTNTTTQSIDHSNTIFDDIDNNSSDAVEPTLYSLLHPLEEFKPVSTTIKQQPAFNTLLDDAIDLSMDTDNVDGNDINISINESLYATMNDIHESLVWTCTTQPLLLTYNNKLRIHKLYVVRQSKNEVTRRLHFLDDNTSNKDSNTNTQPTQSTNNDKVQFAKAVHEADLLYKQLLQLESTEHYNKSSITPELLLECVYTQTESCNPYTNIFLAADITHRPLLCMYDSVTQQLHTYLLYTEPTTDKLTIQFEFALQCVAAVPIQSSWNITDAHIDNPYNNDILVINNKRQLELYTGKHRACNIHINNTTTQQYTNLSDAYSNRVTITTTDNQTIRTTIQTGFRSSLVQRCMQSIAMFLPPLLLHQLRCDLITAIYTNNTVDEFVVLNALLHKYMNKHVPTISTTPSIISPLRARPTLTNNTNVQAPTKLQLSTQQFNNHLVDILNALHLLYEDTKLNVLLKQQRTQLVQLCASIAQYTQHTTYIELYARDYDTIAQQYRTILQSHTMTSTKQPINIYQWLQQCVTGTVTVSNNEFPLLSTNESPYDLSRKIRLFYDILFHQNTQHTNYATTVQQQYTQQEINNTFIKPTSKSRRTSRYSVGNNQSLLSPVATPKPSPNSNNIDMYTPMNKNNYQHTVTQLTPSSPFGILYTPSFLPQRSPISGTSGLTVRTARQSPTSALPPRHSPGTVSKTLNDELPLFSPLLMKRQQQLTAKLHAAAEINTKDTVDSNKHVYEQLLQAMIDENFTVRQLHSLPYGIALPLYEALYQCRCNPLYNISTQTYELIERYDLCKMFVDHNLLSNETKYLLKLESQLELAAGQSLTNTDNTSTTIQNNKLQLNDNIDDTDGTYSVMYTAINQFNTDQRIKEVRHILSSTRYVCLTISKDKLDEQYLEHSTFDLSVEQQLRLLQLSKRICSLSIGRGMFTLWSIQPIVTKPLNIPNICLTGRIPPKNATVELDVSQLPSTYLDWPKYHNGVATGLRINKSSKYITRTWILLNREYKSSTHAGLLLGLGLSGHLDVLLTGDFYWYLASQHIQSQISVVLGISASKRGTRDPTVQKILVVHVPALLSTNLQDMQIPVLTQSVALVSVGLLYQYTADRLIYCRMLEQFNCSTINESTTELDGYILCAGIACGLLTLGRGDNIIGLNDINIVDKLIQYIDGGSSENNNDVVKSHLSNIATQQRPQSKINIDLTAPAATIAFALMYLQTNNIDAAKRLTIPDTLFMLNYIRPDYIMLRIIARCIILWNNIQPTVEWMDTQIPQSIHEYIQPIVFNNKRKYDNKDNHMHIDNQYNKQHNNIDYSILRQVYANIVAGACYALGLRYAGTANTQAAILITQYIRAFRDIKRKKYKHTQHTNDIKTNLNKLDKTTLDHCIYTCCIGLSFIMAGTGDLDTFRLIRSLRTRIDNDTTYGQQMCIHMCIGLLYMGGGTLTLANSIDSVAMLLISFYPRWPITTDDNRYHIQALRHLYVLAVQPRYVQTIDIHTNKTCNIPIQLTVCDSSDKLVQTHTLVTPCLLPPIHTIQTITIESPNYWPIKLDIQQSTQHKQLLQQSSVIYVQSRYNIKEHNILSQHNMINKTTNNTNILIQQFQQLFVCSNNDSLSKYCQQVAQKCASIESPAILNIYMQLIEVLRTAQQNINNIDPIDLYNIKLLTHYYRHMKPTSNSTTLLSVDILTVIEQQLDTLFNTTQNNTALTSKHSVWSSLPFNSATKRLLNQINSTVKPDSLNAGMIALIALQQPHLSVESITALLQHNI